MRGGLLVQPSSSRRVQSPYDRDSESRRAAAWSGPRPANGVPVTLNRLLTATLLLVMTPVVAARAQGVEGTRSATIFVGTGVSLAGNAINEAVGSIDGRPTVFVEQALSNHFSDALRLRFTGSKGLDYNKEAFATLAYGKYNGTERIVGSVSGFPLRARLSNADAFDLEGGLRYYLKPEGPLRTYVAGALGVRFLHATDATFRVTEVGLTLANQPYFKSSTLFIFGGDVGGSYDMTDKTAALVGQSKLVSPDMCRDTDALLDDPVAHPPRPRHRAGQGGHAQPEGHAGAGAAMDHAAAGDRLMATRRSRRRRWPRRIATAPC